MWSFPPLAEGLPPLATLPMWPLPPPVEGSVFPSKSHVLSPEKGQARVGDFASQSRSHLAFLGYSFLHLLSFRGPNFSRRSFDIPSRSISKRIYSHTVISCGCSLATRTRPQRGSLGRPGFNSSVLGALKTSLADRRRLKIREG